LKIALSDAAATLHVSAKQCRVLTNGRAGPCCFTAFWISVQLF
jgi:hypothetical protein